MPPIAPLIAPVNLGRFTLDRGAQEAHAGKMPAREN